MLQNGIVQHHHSGPGQRPPVNLSMQIVIADVVQRHVRIGGVYFYLPVLAEGGQQGGRIIGDACGRRGQRRKKPYFHPP